MKLCIDILAEPKRAALLILFIGATLAPAFGLPSARPVSKDWRLIAESNIIATGKIDASLEMLNKMQASKKSGYINLQVAVHKQINGKVAREHLTVREYLGFSALARQPGAIAKMIGKEMLLFLIYVDEQDCAGIYFTNHGPSALRTFTNKDLLKLKSEIANQNYILQHLKQFPIAKEGPSDKEVRTLLSQLTGAKAQDNAWKMLLKLPKSCIPALIREMDDDRALGVWFSNQKLKILAKQLYLI